MRKLFTLTIVFLGTLVISMANAQQASFKPYQKGDWATILKSGNGKPVVVHFWGVTCPACVKEMPQWGAFTKANPNVNIIFVQADDVSLDSMKKMIKKAGLESAKNYYVNGPFDERVRYEIDPQWHGETPTTFLIDQNGKQTRKTGTIDFRQLKSGLLNRV